MARMHNPPHPGELLDEYRKEADLDQQDLADHLDVSRQQVNAIINGRARIEPEMGVRLALVFNTSAELWLNMQMNHDLWLIDQGGLPKVKPIKRKAA